MSGIFIKDEGFCENTDKICKTCKSPVWEFNSGRSNYPYLCLKCNVGLHDHETDEQDPHYLPKVIVGRHVEGITLNNGLEYLLDDEGNEMVFDGQPAAEAFLLGKGYALDDLQFMYFIEIENQELEDKK